MKLLSEEYWMPVPLPIPPSEGVMSDGRWYVESMIRYEIGVDYPRMQEHVWVKMYQELTMKLAELAMGRKEWFVFQMSPLVAYESVADIMPGVRLRLYMDIMVAETRNVSIPVWTYTASGMLKEWRCGHCESPNELQERHCTQCGAPRAKLLQEMM